MFGGSGYLLGFDGLTTGGGSTTAEVTISIASLDCDHSLLPTGAADSTVD